MSETSTPAASVLDILLRDAPSPTETRGLNEEFFALAANLKKAMDQGLPPAEMKRVRGLWEAAEAARLAVAELTG